MSDIEFVDQSVRDGQQSLWGLRMRAGHMLPIAADMDRAGFKVVDLTGSGMFEIMTRTFKDNPWEFLDLMSAAMPNTELRSATRPNGSMGSGFTLAPFAIIDLFAQTQVKHGITSFWIYDCLYNMDQIERVSRAIHAVGGKPLPAIFYSLSEYHTDEFFADRVRQMASWGVADGIYFEDASGVLTPDRAETLIPALMAAAGDVPIELHCHNTTGMAPLNYLVGLKHGIKVLHAASRPMANGPSLPSLEQTLDNVRRSGHNARLDEERLLRMSGYFEDLARREGYALGVPEEYSVAPYDHQLPGGMLGTLKVQLAEHGLTHRLDEMLDETSQVRRELGYPVMATPISQLVGIQALLNITSGQRYSQVPDDVILYTLGRMGTPPGPFDQDVKDRILGSARAKELAANERPQPTLEELRKQHRPGLSDEELILRTLLNENAVDQMLAAGRVPTDLSPKNVHPLAGLIRALSAPGCSSAVQYSQPDLSITLARD